MRVDENLCLDGRFPPGALLRCEKPVVVAGRCAAHAEGRIAQLEADARAAQEKYDDLEAVARAAIDATAEEKKVECLAFARWYDLRTMLEPVGG